MSPENKSRQLGFYEDDGTTKLRVRPQKGDHMIKPPESKKKKKSRANRPFQELMKYLNAWRQWADQVGIYKGEMPDGLVQIEVGKRFTYISLVGEPGDIYQRQRASPSTMPSLHFSDLSSGAQALYYKFQRRAREQLATTPAQPNKYVYAVYGSTEPGTVEPGVKWENLNEMAEAVRKVTKGQ